jgi:hypothetical protein
MKEVLARETIARYEGSTCKITIARYEGSTCKITIARYEGSTCKMNYRKVCRKCLQDKLSHGMQEVLAK